MSRTCAGAIRRSSLRTFFISLIGSPRRSNTRLTFIAAPSSWTSASCWQQRSTQIWRKSPWARHLLGTQCREPAAKDSRLAREAHGPLLRASLRRLESQVDSETLHSQRLVSLLLRLLHDSPLVLFHRDPTWVAKPPKRLGDLIPYGCLSRRRVSSVGPLPAFGFTTEFRRTLVDSLRNPLASLFVQPPSINHENHH